ncbi:Prefoldin [Chytridium lagenaria]|nr:Prefoldin [Chytridium lagenaria]
MSLEESVNAFRSLQKEYTKAVESRNTLESQLRENEFVQKEFTLLKDGPVFKLIGPVLVKQDLGEARVNVDKRLEYIKGEITRAESLIKTLEDKQEAKKAEISKLQQLQQLAAPINNNPHTPRNSKQKKELYLQEQSCYVYERVRKTL